MIFSLSEQPQQPCYRVRGGSRVASKQRDLVCGYGVQNRSLRPKDWLEQTREEWAKEVNQALEREGYDLSIDHRSLEAQGIDRVPQLHLGYALAMEERGLETERGDRFQEIEQLNKGYELERSQQLEYERALEHSPERDHDLERTHDYGYDLDL